eukprot:1052997_1
MKNCEATGIVNREPNVFFLFWRFDRSRSRVVFLIEFREFRPSRSSRRPSKPQKTMFCELKMFEPPEALMQAALTADPQSARFFVFVYRALLSAVAYFVFLFFTDKILCPLLFRTMYTKLGDRDKANWNSMFLSALHGTFSGLIHFACMFDPLFAGGNKISTRIGYVDVYTPMSVGYMAADLFVDLTSKHIRTQKLMLLHHAGIAILFPMFVYYGLGEFIMCYFLSMELSTPFLQVYNMTAIQGIHSRWRDRLGILFSTSFFAIRIFPMYTIVRMCIHDFAAVVASTDMPTWFFYVCHFGMWTPHIINAIWGAGILNKFVRKFMGKKVHMN